MPISHHFHDCTALLVWRFVVVKYEALPFLDMFKPVHFTVAADAGVGEDDSDLWSSLDEVTSSLLQDESYEGSQSSPTSLVAGTTDFLPLYDQDEVFSPLSSTASGCPSSISVPSATIAQCQQDIPVPPDISPLLHSSHMSTSEQTASRVPTPPDITPLLKGALSSANIQLPLVSAQPSSVSVCVCVQFIVHREP